MSRVTEAYLAGAGDQDVALRELTRAQLLGAVIVVRRALGRASGGVAARVGAEHDRDGVDPEGVA